MTRTGQALGPFIADGSRVYAMYAAYLAPGCIDPVDEIVGWDCKEEITLVYFKL